MLINYHDIIARISRKIPTDDIMPRDAFMYNKLQEWLKNEKEQTHGRNENEN